MVFRVFTGIISTFSTPWVWSYFETLPDFFQTKLTLDLGFLWGPVPAARKGHLFKWWWWFCKGIPLKSQKPSGLGCLFFSWKAVLWEAASSWNSLGRKSTCCFGRKGHNSSNHQSLSFVAIYRSYILSPSKSLHVCRSGILSEPSFVTRYLGWVLVSYPRCSMNGTFTYIYHIFDPNVGSYIIWHYMIYVSHMEHLGIQTVSTGKVSICKHCSPGRRGGSWEMFKKS